MSAGYSGAPLAKKLGINPDTTIHPMGAPREYRDWLAPLPDLVSFAGNPPKSGCDVVHLFVTSLAEFEKLLPKARRAMKPDGALATDLVDVKVCAVTELWSGLKFVVRRHLC